MKLLLNTKMGLSAMRTACNNENGVALVIALMFLAILGLLGTTAYVITTTDMKIGSNYNASVQASNVAQAGINEALYRLGLYDDGGTVAPPSGSMININGLTNNNAAISIDPNGLLSNGNDDDGNGAIDDISDLNYNGTYNNRNWQTKIMLKTSDDADTTTTIYTPTIQPSANWLEYSSATVDGTELTIEFKKDVDDMDSDGDTTEIVFYNESLTNPFNVDGLGGNPASGQPIVLITATGKSQGSIAEIQTEAVYQPINIQAEAAFMVDMIPVFTGASLVSGFNHDGRTSESDKPNNRNLWGTTTQFYHNGLDNHGGDEKYDCPNPNTSHSDNDTTLCGSACCMASGFSEEELGDNKYPEYYIPYASFLETSGHKPGVWTTTAPNSITPGGTNDIFGGSGSAGTVTWKKELNDPTQWKTLAELLGVSDAVLAKILASANVTEADMDVSGVLNTAPQGVIYINNAGGTTLKITSSTPSNLDGWGLMYVTGDIQFQTAGFKGLIYVEGDADIQAGFWIMGCLAVKGVTTGNFSAGAAHFLYSKDVLESYVNKGMKCVPLTWKDRGLS